MIRPRATAATTVVNVTAYDGVDNDDTVITNTITTIPTTITRTRPLTRISTITTATTRKSFIARQTAIPHRISRIFNSKMVILLTICIALIITADGAHLKTARRHRDTKSTAKPSQISTTHIPLLDTNPCLVHYCPKGQECVVSYSEEDNGAAQERTDVNSEQQQLTVWAECICQRSCEEDTLLTASRRARRLVCGSDGHVYPSHCELHRAACLSGNHITVEHGSHCVSHGKGWAPGLQHIYPFTDVTTNPEPNHSPSLTNNINNNNDDTTTISPSNSIISTMTPLLSSTVNHEPTITTSKIITTSNVKPLNDNDSKFKSKTDSSGDDILDNEIDEDNEIDDEDLGDDLDYDKEECTVQEYEIMKDNLLLYNHARLMSKDNHSKDYLVSIMFSHYDINNNGNLESDELKQVADTEHLEALSGACSLSDMVKFDDSDQDSRLSINEFYLAFSKFYSVSVVSLDKALETNHLSARVGDNVEIKCDVTGSPLPPIVWRRNGIDLASLNEDEVRVFSDGSLYLTKIQLHHAGNYTCHAQRNKDIIQTHVLIVHTIPEVKVTPKIQSKRPGEDAIMYCHVVGEPFPKVEWLKNDESLRLDLPHKYQIVGNGTALKVRNIAYADTGAYMCQATNTGGLTRDISSLVVQEQPTPTATLEERRFFAFHEWGISIYEPSTCRLNHQVQATDIIPGTQEYVCGDKGIPCSWGRAINVADRYVYVTQPERDRVLIISKIQMVVVDVVTTDKYPVELYYVPHLDQVWVLNWRSEFDTGVKTIQVIRDAGQKRKHHTVHPEPIDGQFDLVKGLYIPSPNQEPTQHDYKYGYVTHSNQRGLYKLDLSNLRYIRSVDLTPYNCVPNNIEFSPIYGLVILQCVEPVTNRATGQLLLDYLTDSVVGSKPSLSGVPYVSPDARRLVTLDHTDNGATLVVQEVTATGLKFSFDVKTSLNISDLTFYPSQTTHSYDLYSSASDKEDILFLNLLSGKVEMITGVGKAMPSSLAQWGNPNRPITASGQFGQYMVSPSNAALFVVNGRTRTVNCEIGGLTHPRAVVWTTLQYH